MSYLATKEKPNSSLKMEYQRFIGRKVLFLISLVLGIILLAGFAATRGQMNFVRKHSLANLENGTAKDWREATLRIFTSKPGTYQSGTNLAVYASAWKDEKDLSDIFVYWNGYAYGKGVAGKESHQNFVNSLKSVDVTYNKVVSEEYDLFGCCYFGTQGGMTAAARHLSGKDVKAYYGGLQV